jgi:cytochrome bd ubiquinol oxidase subunit I
MTVLDMYRWQFGITAVCHFFLVPVTIGLAFLIGGYETAWIRTGNQRWRRLAVFFGPPLLISYAAGVVTGVVQEFQFGIDWSPYERLVSDIFGAALAIQALVAFFVVATLLAVWYLGWDHVPRGMHVSCMWLAAVAMSLSAYFILAVNSWLQHPVGYRYDPATGHAEITSWLDVLANPVQLATFPHTLAGCFLVAGGLITGVAMWHLLRTRDGQAGDAATWRGAVTSGALATLTAAAVTMISGDVQGKVMTRYQPMKMAAAEALYHTAQPAPFSLFTIGTLDGSRPVFELTLPRLLSFLATGDFNAKVEGIDNLQAQYTRLYGPGSYRPVIPVSYWSFRLMIAAGLLAAVVAVVALWSLRKGRMPADWAGWHRSLLRWSTLGLPFLPLAASTLGWVFTEVARQPWLIFGHLKISQAASGGSAGLAATVLVAVVLGYGLVTAAAGWLIWRTTRNGLAAPGAAPPPAAYHRR